jgi:hypothetical protein
MTDIARDERSGKGSGHTPAGPSPGAGPGPHAGTRRSPKQSEDELFADPFDRPQESAR